MLDVLMRTFGVVVFDVVLDTLTQFLDAISGGDIDILTLNSPPEPHYPHVVQTPAPSVHAYAYFLASLFPGRASVLASLVGIDDFRLAVRQSY